MHYEKSLLNYRGLLEAEEASVDQLESKLEKILKVCGSMVDSGKTYVGQQRFEYFIYLTVHSACMLIS